MIQFLYVVRVVCGIFMHEMLHVAPVNWWGLWAYSIIWPKVAWCRRHKYISSHVCAITIARLCDNTPAPREFYMVRSINVGRIKYMWCELIAIIITHTKMQCTILKTRFTSPQLIEKNEKGIYVYVFNAMETRATNNKIAPRPHAHLSSGRWLMWWHRHATLIVRLDISRIFGSEQSISTINRKEPFTCFSLAWMWTISVTSSVILMGRQVIE